MAGAGLAKSFAAALAMLALSTSLASSSPAAVETAKRSEVSQPKVRFDPIQYDNERRRQMANYSNRHYGKREWRLDPRAVVLHYTASSTYESVFNTFASNAPALGESPGVCSQFVVDKDGTIYQLTRLYVRCRHTIGLNHVSIGIEMVQEQLGSSHASSEAILDRREQVRAAVHLTAWLKQRYGIDSRDVLGHSMANDSHLFKDLSGWRNDHTDWPKAEVKDFRKRVKRFTRSAR